MAEPLQTRQPHQRQQVADVQARRGRIEARVRGDRLRTNQFGQPFGRIVDQPTPRQFFEEVRHGICDLLYQLDDDHPSRAC